MEVHCSPHSPTGQGGAGLRDLTFEPGTAACIHHLRPEVCVCVTDAQKLGMYYTYCANSTFQPNAKPSSWSFYITVTRYT